MYNYLLVINSNLGSVSHRYWDTTTYWPKIANFAHPLSFSALVRNDPLRIYEKALRRVFHAAEREDLVILVCTVFDWSTRVTDGQTDGQTDRQNCDGWDALKAAAAIARKISLVPDHDNVHGALIIAEPGPRLNSASGSFDECRTLPNYKLVSPYSSLSLCLFLPVRVCVSERVRVGVNYTRLENLISKTASSRQSVVCRQSVSITKTPPVCMEPWLLLLLLEW